MTEEQFFTALFYWMLWAMMMAFITQVAGNGNRKPIDGFFLWLGVPLLPIAFMIFIKYYKVFPAFIIEHLFNRKIG